MSRGLVRILESVPFIVIVIVLCVIALGCSLYDENYPDVFTFGILVLLQSLHLWGRLRR